ncbi:hypothetical protein RHGRI_032093 [Rhododendron griersonianum]|uniref:Uncharacterized protein n=1 Tax=Rhododendron griersonianum TaxID=479676 RepID=A0AAV6IAY2_9ERIC|nr:hypothetical protein RHGRI_032093 [Rhododendron griersonianum]
MFSNLKILDRRRHHLTTTATKSPVHKPTSSSPANPLPPLQQTHFLHSTAKRRERRLHFTVTKAVAVESSIQYADCRRSHPENDDLPPPSPIDLGRFGALVLKHGVFMGIGFVVSKSGHLLTAAHNLVTAINIEEDEEYLHHLGHVVVFSKKDADIDPVRVVTECLIEKRTFLSTFDVPETFKMVEIDMSAGPGQSGGALFSIGGWNYVYYSYSQHAYHWIVYDPIVFEAIHHFFDPFDVLTVLAERQEGAREGERAKDEEEFDSAKEIDSAEEN